MALPDFTTQSGATYKTNIDNTIAAITDASGNLFATGTVPLIRLSDNQDKGSYAASEIIQDLSFWTTDVSGIGAHETAAIKAVNEVGAVTTPGGALWFYTSFANAVATVKVKISEGGDIVRTNSVASGDSGGFRAEGTGPIYSWNETDAPLDEKKWRMFASGGAFNFQTMNDAEGAFENVFNVSRTGEVIDATTFTDGDVGIGGTPGANNKFLVSGASGDVLGKFQAANSAGNVRGLLVRNSGTANVANTVEHLFALQSTTAGESNYAAIRVGSPDIGNGVHEGNMGFRVAQGGSLVEMLTLDGVAEEIILTAGLTKFHVEGGADEDVNVGGSLPDAADFGATSRSTTGVLKTFSMPASLLGEADKGIKITMWGERNGSGTASITFQYRFGTTPTSRFTEVITTSELRWTIVVYMFRVTSTSAERCLNSFVEGRGNTLGVQLDSSGINLAAAQTIDLNVVTINGADLITQRGLLVEVLN